MLPHLLDMLAWTRDDWLGRRLRRLVSRLPRVTSQQGLATPRCVAALAAALAAQMVLDSVTPERSAGRRVAVRRGPN
jgi:hypothetical protein